MPIVYVLLNDAMPGLIKVGMTSTSVEQRMKELDQTPVPLPFTCYYAAEVADARRVEQALHRAFGDARVREKREFFRLDPMRVVAVLELVGKDVTPRESSAQDSDDAVALDRAARRSSVTFEELHIAPGTILSFSRKPEENCSVVGGRKVEFRGSVTSLSGSAAVILQEMGFKGKQYQGQAYWMHGDDTIAALAERLQTLQDE